MGDIELSFNSFCDASDCETLVLGPDPQNPTVDVEILIVNREFPEPSAEENVPAPDQRLDFGVYYDLLASPVPAGGRLVPQRAQGSNRFLRPGGCSPVAINS